MMLNQVPGRLGLKLTTPFELVHNSKPDSKTWFELFSIGYFNQDTDNAKSSSKQKAHILDAIAVGQYDRSNSIIFYNPITFRLDKSKIPITNFPNSLIFDGGLTCGLLRNKTKPIHETFPPGTRVSIKRKDIPTCGTIKNIPIPLSPILKTAASPIPEDLEQKSITSEDPKSPPYVILLDNGITVERSYDNIIKDTRDDKSTPKSTSNAAALEGIPHFLRHDFKVTMDNKGGFHKGYINH